MDENKITTTGAAPDEGAAPIETPTTTETPNAEFRKAADKVFKVHAGLLKRLAE